MIGSESTWSQSWSAMFSTHFCQPSSGNNTTTECYSFISYRYKSRWHSHIRHILSTNIGRPTILFSSAPVVPCFALDSVSVSPTAWESFFLASPVMDSSLAPPPPSGPSDAPGLSLSSDRHHHVMSKDWKFWCIIFSLALSVLLTAVEFVSRLFLASPGPQFRETLESKYITIF